MKRTRIATALTVVLTASALVVIPITSAQAYAPTGGVLFNLGNAQCLKGLGNCAVYPKSAQLPDGRLVAAFENSTVPASGSAAGQTIPIYTSGDYGTTWSHLSEVKAPAYMSSDPAYAKYVSAWTNPYLYVLPEDVGTLKKGTLVLAAVVSGDDAYYTEHKAANPNWVPNNDGDRSNVAIALYSSTDDGANWSFDNIVAQGGWQGGSAGAIGKNIATANTYKQIDPVWEPYLMAYQGQLVTYYSDENDYTGYDPTTGVATLDPANPTAPDPGAQILTHRTWDGTSGSAWSAPVIDVSGTTFTSANGTSEIGGGRPGMANVVQTADGKWMLTYEYWGGGANVRVKIADDPLKFFSVGGAAGDEISLANGSQGVLPYAAGSRGLSWGGSPVLIRMRDGALAYNASGSGDVWVNQSGRSDGVWTQYQTTLGSGYSRNLQYVAGTGRLEILQGTWGGASSSAIIRYADVDFGHSDGAYYQIVNKKTAQVIGTTNNTTDANIGNHDVPDVRLEDADSAASADTQFWHITTKPDGNVTLLNKSGGRAAAIWTGNATTGQRIGQWVDNTANGLFSLHTKADGTVYFQSVQNPSLFLTGTASGANLTLQPSTNGDGTQDWTLVQQAPTVGDLTPGTQSTALVGDAPVGAGRTLPLDATATDPAGNAQHSNVTGHAYLFGSDGAATDLGNVAFGPDQKGSVTLPATLPFNLTYKVAVVFDGTPLIWDTGTTGKAAATVSAPAVSSNWGTAATVTVTFSSPLPVTGQVALTEGTTDRGLATLNHGTATFTLPVGLAAGDHTLTATYSGSDTVQAASTSTTVTVVLPTGWSKTTAYQTGDIVSFNGSVYKAGWYTKGETPGTTNTGAWQQLAMTENGATVWTASRVFLAGDTIVYQGNTFRADWYTRGETPGSTTGPWEEIATAPDGTALWTPSRVFNTGDKASYNGIIHVAKWYTRNQVPGSPNGPWAAVS